MKLFILRPEPGACETAERARAIGLEPVVAPLFTIEGVTGPPTAAEDFDAVFLTSANGARFAPAGLTALPCFTVGERTAAAARVAGFTRVVAGPGDAMAAALMMAEAGVKKPLHPCGRDHIAVEAAGLAMERRIVYAAEPIPSGPFEGPAVAMIHSARAGALFAERVGERSRIAIAAISPAAAAAAGEGWAAKVVADAPRDHALLELAAKLCNHGVDVVRDGNGL